MAMRVAIIVSTLFSIALLTPLMMTEAYAHGCQAQGACCAVGSACVEISANSPVFMMFAVVGLGVVTMMAFYGKSIQKSRLGAIFNIFI